MTGRERFVAACTGAPVDCTPIWIMRQAGRYLPEYRELRTRYSMMEALEAPELAVRITLMPLDRFDLDAAIIFSDLLPPLRGMGLNLEFVPGVGPRIDPPLRSIQAIDRLGVPPAAETMAATLEALELVRPEVHRRGRALIGFAGGPFTLASYAIEGGGSRTYAHTKALMHSEPAAWDRLMTKLVGLSADYLDTQLRAGADCVQVFDSWAGALGRADYVRYVQPYSRMLFDRLGAEALTIHFSTGTGTFLDAVAEAGGSVIGVDWRLDLDRAHQIAGRPLMGNLDPGVLLAPWREVQIHADDVLTRGGTGHGHVFNLGHGILPGTPVDTVRRLVEYVHAFRDD